ncbi:MAG TPA: HAMP domain-containing protein [Desulfobacterales bacterium]|nr:HAMP domain-containing protein [Desulfobacterales bacterium]
MSKTHSAEKQKSPGSHKKRARLPLFVRVTIAVLLLSSLFAGILGYFTSSKLKNIFYDKAVESGELILGYFASNVKIPLLTNDTLRLTSLLNETTSTRGIDYAFIVDRQKIIRVSSNPGDIGKRFKTYANAAPAAMRHGSPIISYTNHAGQQMLDLSQPIRYNKKLLGIAHLGLSGSSVQNSAKAAQRAVLLAVLVPGLCAVLVLACIIYLYGLWLRGRIAELIRAVAKYGQGSLQHQIKNIDNNELGDLALALNKMSDKLMAHETAQVQLEEYLKFSSVDQILEAPLPTGESYAVRRQVAVFFAGVKEFGSYASTRKPEEVVAALNEYIGITAKIISKHGGYVDKFIGDALVGIFGVSLYKEDHTSRAVQAAVELQKYLSTDGAADNQLLANVCIGISSGVVLSGNIGSHSKIEYSSIGESIKEAYWLNGLAKAGEIILGEEIYTQLRDLIIVEPLTPQRLMGRPDVIKTYRLISLADNSDIPGRHNEEK